MTTLTTTTSNSQMHNDIMAADSREPKPTTPTEEAVPEHNVVETYKNTTPEKHAYFDVKAEAIHMILSGIRDDIYFTVDAYLDTISYYKLFDILKQYQNEINDICAKKLARNANPLALVVATQKYPDTHYQASKPHKTYAPSSKPTPSTRSHAPTRNRGKERAKSITPPSESASEEYEDNDPEQAQRDKDMQKNLVLIAKYIKNIYKPTNNNLRTSSNSKNKNVDTSPRNMNDNQTRQFGNQRTVTVVGARETVRNQVVPLSAEQGDWLYDIDDESDEHELEAHYICRSALHDQEIELEKYKKYKNCQLEKEKVERKLKDTLGLLTQQKFQSDEALKTQAFKTFQFKEKNAELVHQRSLKHTRYDLLRKEKEQLKKDFNIRQDKDIEKLIALEHQAKFVNPKLTPESSSKTCLYNSITIKMTCGTICFLPTQASLSKSRHAFNVVQHNITNFKIIVDLDWEKRMDNILQQPITHEITVLVKDLLIPLAIETKVNANEFERALKQEMFEDLEYVQSLEKEIDELEYKKAEFLNEYDLLLQECVSTNIMNAILCSIESLDEKTELKCFYLEKYQECKDLKTELSKQNENVENKSFNELSKKFIHDKNTVISELKKLIEKLKGKSVDTKFEKPSVVRQPNAFKFQKTLVLGKPSAFSNYPFSKSRFAPTTNMNQNLKISKLKTKLKDNDKGSRSKITRHEGTSLQQR
ncbi:hypothetical protein Tco_0563255 [Tanacetum coccineum]